MKNNVYINLFQFIRRLYILTINLLPFVSVAEHFLGKVTLKAVTDFSLLSKLRVSVPHIYIYTLRLCCPRPMTGWKTTGSNLFGVSSRPGPFSPRRFSYPETIKSINFKVFLLLDIQPGIRIPVYPPWVLLLSLPFSLLLFLSLFTSSLVKHERRGWFSKQYSEFFLSYEEKKIDRKIGREEGRFIVGDCLHNLQRKSYTELALIFFYASLPFFWE